MRYQKTGKIDTLRLLIIAFLAIAVIIGSEASKTLLSDPLLDEKVAAAHLMQRAMGVLKAERLRNGITVDPKTDPNETGMIGEEYTDLTTTLGSLLSKRTATNPNFAGAIVEMMHRAGTKVGDDVAISFSGSFPTLNIGVLSAVSVLKLNAVIISSVGASMYGANHPQWTWLDMEGVLKSNGILPYASHAASLGGIAETRGGLGEKGIEVGLEAIRRNGVTYLDERGVNSLRQDIERRLAIYDTGFRGRKPSLFINTGGPLTSLGNSPEAYSISNGLLKKVPLSTHPQKGIIFRMAEKGVPVIHLLNIRGLAQRYGLPMDPVPLPPIPSGSIMKPQRYSGPLALSGLAFLCLVMITAGRKRQSVRSSLTRT